MGTLEAYSSARIIFKPDANPQETRTYPDRSLVELRMHDVGDYSLRAVDVQNDRKEIFNFPLVKRNQYYFGTSETQPDSIRGDVGVYQLLLNVNSRNQFHDTLRTCLEEFIRERSDSSEPEIDQHVGQRFDLDFDPPSRPSSATTESFSPPPPKLNKVNLTRSTPSFNVTSRPTTTTSLAPVAPAVADHKNILVDVRKLSTYIHQGDVDEAARLAKKLAQHGILLKNQSSQNLPIENEFQIKVQFDGNEYGVDEEGPHIYMNVYESTTIRELRAAFDYSHNYPLSSQYFIVNGILAHDDQTMHDLKVGPSSLLVLFLITQPKTFATRGPWTCTNCLAENNPLDVKCKLCRGSRTH